MKLKLPDKALLIADRDADGNVKFTYAERYNDPEIPKRTAPVAAAMFEEDKLPLTVSSKDNWLSVTSNGFVDHALFVEMMHGEFECWTSERARNRVLDMIMEKFESSHRATKLTAKELDKLKAELSSGEKLPDPPVCFGEPVCRQCGGAGPVDGLCIHCSGAGG